MAALAALTARRLAVGLGGSLAAGHALRRAAANAANPASVPKGRSFSSIPRPHLQPQAHALPTPRLGASAAHGLALATPKLLSARGALTLLGARGVSVSQTFASQALHSASRAPQRARGALGGLHAGRGALALAARAAKGGAGATAASPAAAAAAVVGRRGLSSRGSSSGGGAGQSGGVFSLVKRVGGIVFFPLLIVWKYKMWALGALKLTKLTSLASLAITTSRDQSTVCS